MLKPYAISHPPRSIRSASGRNDDTLLPRSIRSANEGWAGGRGVGPPRRHGPDGGADEGIGRAAVELAGDGRGRTHAVDQQTRGEPARLAGCVARLDGDARIPHQGALERDVVQDDVLRAGRANLAQAQRREGVGLDRDIQHVVHPQVMGPRLDALVVEMDQAACVAVLDDLRDLRRIQQPDRDQFLQFLMRNVPFAVNGPDGETVKDQHALAIHPRHDGGVQQVQPAARVDDIKRFNVGGERVRRVANALHHNRRLIGGELLAHPRLVEVDHAAQMALPLWHGRQRRDQARVLRAQFPHQRVGVK
ncbi:MAG: hypothetical protein IVW57_16270, partial [Ktedonobacterales bacterium]|nr:hypothetical protein [Ktedonobacterales bacterium]